MRRFCLDCGRYVEDAELNHCIAKLHVLPKYNLEDQVKAETEVKK